jgi:hypothetical protein
MPSIIVSSQLNLSFTALLESFILPFTSFFTHFLPSSLFISDLSIFASLLVFAISLRPAITSKGLFKLLSIASPRSFWPVFIAPLLIALILFLIFHDLFPHFPFF